jgi:glutamyl-tRNA synthetase
MSGIAFTATRLAPSPTGALHLGHARTFLITWWMARQAGAKIYMRMEDLDVGRAKPESVQQAYDDLRWLGMDWDAWQGEREVVQSHRTAHYAAELERLWQADRIYPCTCRRADIAAVVAASASAPHESDAQLRYPGTCAGITRGQFAGQSAAQTAATIRQQTGKEVCWRLRVPAGVQRFDDVLAGPQSFDVAAETGDFPLTRFDGTPAYQLACVVDDHAMGIDLVVRGDDLLSSTPRQMLVHDARGSAPTRYAHVPLVVGIDGKRLAKRHGESRIAQFRAAGVPAERIVGWVAWRSGQIEAPRDISAPELIKRFDPRTLPRQRVVMEARDVAMLT